MTMRDRLVRILDPDAFDRAQHEDAMVSSREATEMVRRRAYERLDAFLAELAIPCPQLIALIQKMTAGPGPDGYVLEGQAIARWRQLLDAMAGETVIYEPWRTT